MAIIFLAGEKDLLFNKVNTILENLEFLPITEKQLSEQIQTLK